jgi:hypothetical protein
VGAKLQGWTYPLIVYTVPLLLRGLRRSKARDFTLNGNDTKIVCCNDDRLEVRAVPIEELTVLVHRFLDLDLQIYYFCYFEFIYFWEELTSYVGAGIAQLV